MHCNSSLLFFSAAFSVQPVKIRLVTEVRILETILIPSSFLIPFLKSLSNLWSYLHNKLVKPLLPASVATIESTSPYYQTSSIFERVFSLYYRQARCSNTSFRCLCGSGIPVHLSRWLCQSLLGHSQVVNQDCKCYVGQEYWLPDGLELLAS